MIDKMRQTQLVHILFIYLFTRCSLKVDGPLKDY